MPWICWRWVSVPISGDKEPQPEPSLRLPFRQESEDMMMFQGYDQQTVDFLWGIRFNNDRSWFQEHKEQYQTHLLAPTRALGEQLYDGLHAMLPHEPLILKVSRIYRDARRLHGQGPYKDHLWLCVRTGDQDWTGRPTFYFEIAPDYYSYGMGFWCAAPALMALYRQRIDADPKPLEKLVRRFDRQQALVAFAGIDPMPNQSGEKNVRSNKSSKRGSPYLRKTLFSIMMCLLQSAPADEPVFQFLDRKRSEGKPYYVYMTAGANKFLRRYYAKVRDYLATLDNFPPVDMDSTGLNHLN